MRRSFRFHDLGDEEFENLVCHLCFEILGTGIVVFAVGPDGGRDGKFEGTAEKFPSTHSPLSGKFIIQAKHTSNPIASCSEKGFGKILDGEGPKLKKLIEADEIEHYLVFTNRRKPAQKSIQKEKDLKKIGLKTVYIFGDEQLRLWLTASPKIWSNLGFDRFERKFHIEQSDLTEVISEFHSTLAAQPSDRTEAPSFPFKVLTKKNKINSLTKPYFEMIMRDSLPHFKPIENFLKNPRNAKYRNLYEDTADEIKRKIIASGDAFDSFDDALTYVLDLLTEGNTLLKGKRRYASIFLHYMYCTCDIGQHDTTLKAS